MVITVAATLGNCKTSLGINLISKIFCVNFSKIKNTQNQAININKPYIR